MENSNIIEQISDNVQKKVNLENEQYFEAIKKNQKQIEDFLSFTLYPDLVDDEIAEIKKEILSLYKENISDSVSKYEIYCHDLDPRIVAAISELLNCIVDAETEQNIDIKKEMYSYAYRFACFIKHLSHFLLIKAYQRRIDEYHNNLKNFNHNGVYIGDVKFADVIDQMTMEFNDVYEAAFSVYETYYEERSGLPHSDFKNVEKDIGFDEAAKILENIIKKIEENYPEIIDNGYKYSWFYRTVRLMLDVAAGAFLVYSILKLII